MQKELFRFYENAIKGNICEKGRDAWLACKDDKKALVALSLARYAIPFFATYCHEGRGLSKEHILRHYAHLVNGNHVFYGCDGAGMEYTSELYVAHGGSVIANCDTLHLMWCEKTNVIVPQTKCTTLFLSNNDNITIDCKGYNNITLHILDDSKAVVTHGDDNTHITAYIYGNGNISTICQNLTIRKKQRELEL